MVCLINLPNHTSAIRLGFILISYEKARPTYKFEKFIFHGSKSIQVILEFSLLHLFKIITLLPFVVPRKETIFEASFRTVCTRTLRRRYEKILL